jgi:uncharacterized delta-60 repeat protein
MKIQISLPTLILIFAALPGYPTTRAAAPGASGESIKTIISFATTNLYVSEKADVAVITVQCPSSISESASVDYSTQDGTALENLNYLSTSGRLDFGPFETEKTIAVPILDDGLPGADTRLSLTLSDPSHGATVNVRSNMTTLTTADNERPGSIDFNFNPIIETTNTGSGGFHIALQPDGKLIVAGDFQHVNGVSRNGICRLNADGSLDASFDPKGTLVAGVGEPGYSPSISVYSLVLQPDGKILVRGDFNSGNGLNYTNFIRFNADGSVDTGFVPDKASHPLSLYGHGAAMAVQSDGKILVAEGDACCESKSAELARLNADGSSDTTFVTLEVVGVDGGWGSTFNCIVIDGDGRALFEGNTDSTDQFLGGPKKGLIRLNADGSIDESFHPIMDRLGVVDIGSRTKAVVQPDGKIVTVGFFNQVNGVDRLGLARLNSDGSTDMDFVPENRYEEGSYDLAPLALALEAEGKVLVVYKDGSIARMNSDGSRDLTFDFGVERFQQNGLTLTSSDIAVQSDGQILVSFLATDLASANGRVTSGLMRLNGDVHLKNSRAHFRSITGASTGKLQLTLDVVPYRNYSIETSTDLTNWTVIATSTAGDYLLNVTDSAATVSHRFYRAFQTVR